MDTPKLTLPPRLVSPRLVLRPYHPGDAETYLHAIQENRDHLSEFMPAEMEAMQNTAEAEAFIRWQNGGWEAGNLFIYGVWVQASGGYVGEAYLANPDWHVPSLELGYFLLQGEVGKGYATEAARRLLHCAFEDLQVSRVDLQCRADNLASQRVAERCGFRLEGCQRLRHRKKTGELVDRLWFGLLRSEWEAQRRELLSRRDNSSRRWASPRGVRPTP